MPDGHEYEPLERTEGRYRGDLFASMRWDPSQQKKQYLVRVSYWDYLSNDEMTWMKHDDAGEYFTGFKAKYENWFKTFEQALDFLIKVRAEADKHYIRLAWQEQRKSEMVRIA